VTGRWSSSGTSRCPATGSRPAWPGPRCSASPPAAASRARCSPRLYIFDTEALDSRAELVVRHRIPFSTLDLPEAERDRVYGDGPIEYSHTLTAQIGGQLAAGFVLTHLTEAPHHADLTARYMPGYFATRALRPSPP
jgi:hypothetical protein